MYNKDLVANSLHQIQNLLDTITYRTHQVGDIDDFLSSPIGMIQLDHMEKQVSGHTRIGNDTKAMNENKDGMKERIMMAYR